ncbi:MAG: hypothetical protein U0835_13250 [Isosphaeraceae bacterium]
MGVTLVGIAYSREKVLNAELKRTAEAERRRHAELVAALSETGGLLFDEAVSYPRAIGYYTRAAAQLDDLTRRHGRAEDLTAASAVNHLNLARVLRAQEDFGAAGEKLAEAPRVIDTGALTPQGRVAGRDRRRARDARP